MTKILGTKSLLTATMMAVTATTAAALAQTSPAKQPDFGPLTIQHREARDVAQRLINDALGTHPNVVIMAMHVTPPGKSQNEIIASNIGRIGKAADPDDLHVIATGESKPEVAKTGDRFEDEVPLKDSQGRIIGALGIVFAYKDGDDKAALVREAEAIRDGFAKAIPSVSALFEAAS